ncbi:hypothetical protein DES40_2565 [Litorimonas taeanensis]|uniref:Uncharacterized protein n=1 Tax=Litorimonas taeanensis TaxID=568099 RepID=A0A420WFL1_9PROT|nr:hypothetical protein [Litorimonas taeanensis]RKQ69756.1 hypothetical protein DES40_2565 [Litorimonas taeanensis]
MGSFFRYGQVYLLVLGLVFGASFVALAVEMNQMGIASNARSPERKSEG